MRKNANVDYAKRNQQKEERKKKPKQQIIKTAHKHPSAYAIWRCDGHINTCDKTRIDWKYNTLRKSNVFSSEYVNKSEFLIIIAVRTSRRTQHKKKHTAANKSFTLKVDMFMNCRR